MRDPLLWLHVATGTAGLLTGPLWVAARLRGRRGDGLAWAYLLAVAAVAVSGGVLAVTTPGLAWLLPVAVLTGDGDRRRALECGFQLHLRKPAGALAVCDAVRQVHAQSRADASRG